MFRHIARALPPAVATTLFVLSLAPAAAAVELLDNGGFEDGTSGWNGIGLSATGCTTRSGNGALNLTAASSSATARAWQEAGAAAGQGPYTFSGYVSLGSGPKVTAAVRWSDAAGATLLETSKILAPTTGYEAFSVPVVAAPPNAVTVAVELRLTDGPGSACFDDLSLEGPAPVPPTATPTATPVPSATPTSTPTPTRTPAQPSATRTPSPVATARPSATATPGPREAPATLVNGGFEEGLDPWQRFGGELRVVSAPVWSGTAAGALSSSTSSTKWAYQVVRVEPAGSYELFGYLRPGPGVSEAYLRISWYSSEDGSGRALGNTDSTERLTSVAGSYSGLTTGPVEAPAGARSARVRVMLAPSSAGAAVLYMDGLAFGPAEAGEPAAQRVTPAADEETTPPEPGDPSSTAPAAAAPSVGQGSSAAPPAGAGPTAQVLSARRAQESLPAPDTQPSDGQGQGPRSSGRSPAVIALIVLGLFSLGLAVSLRFLRRPAGH